MWFDGRSLAGKSAASISGNMQILFGVHKEILKSIKRATKLIIFKAFTIYQKITIAQTKM